MDEPLVSFTIVQVCTIAAAYVPCRADSTQGPSPGAPPPPADAAPPICIAVVPVYPNLQVTLAVLSLSVLLPSGNAAWLTKFLDFCLSPQQGRSRGDGPALGTQSTPAPGAGPRGCPRRLCQRTCSACPHPHPPHPARPCCDVCTHCVSFGLSLPWTFREGNPCQSTLPPEGGEAPDVSGTPLRTQTLENTYFHFCTSPPRADQSSQGAPPGVTPPASPAGQRLAVWLRLPLVA